MPYTFNPFTGTLDYYQAASGSMVYPGAGVPVSTGSAWGTSKTAPSGAIVGDTDTQTLSNKTLTAPVVAVLKPASDSTTAMQFTKADGSTVIATVDSTNKRLGIGTVSPRGALDVDTGTNSSMLWNGNQIDINGTANPGFRIYRNGTGGWYFYNGVGGVNAFGIYDITAGADRLAISTTGAMRFNAYGAGTLVTDASGNITASSDTNLKTNIVNYAASVAQVLKIQPVQFNWTPATGYDTTQIYTGWSAQNVAKSLPEAIGTDPNGNYTVNDRPIIAALVNAVKELVTQINVLRTQAKLTTLDYTVADITDTTKILKHKA